MFSTLSKEHDELLQKDLSDTDPEVFKLLQQEIERQKSSIILIASENFTSKSVFDSLGSPMSNKYSEGYPGARYYAGNKIIDQVEILCQKRALKAFNLEEKKWGVNVQPLSGSPANLHVYLALMKPHERLMGLNLPHGGHLSHGYQTSSRKISAVSTYFETLPYEVNLKTGLIDYEMFEKTALLFRPKIIVAGSSAYCRFFDYKRIREIADKVQAYLLADMAHVSGLVAAGVIPSPFDYADIVTTTTHKSLRGPRGAMIFFRRGIRFSSSDPSKDVLYDLEEKINFSVFPGHQGGPHNHTITAIATCLNQTFTSQFKEYQLQVLKNAKVLERCFKQKGYELVSDGTDIHMVLVALKNKGIDGSRVDAVCERVNIFLNKNSVPGDVSAINPTGIRIGTPAMTSRGFGEKDFEKVVDYIDILVKFAKDLQDSLPQGKNKLNDFKLKLNTTEYPQLESLKNDVSNWAVNFPYPI